MGVRRCALASTLMRNVAVVLLRGVRYPARNAAVATQTSFAAVASSLASWLGGGGSAPKAETQYTLALIPLLDLVEDSTAAKVGARFTLLTGKLQANCAVRTREEVDGMQIVPLAGFKAGDTV